MEENYFKHGGFCRVEFSKIAVLVTWPVFACDSTSAVRSVTLLSTNRPKWRRNIEESRADIGHVTKTAIFANSRWRTVAILKIAVRRLEFAKIAIFVTWPVTYICMRFVISDMNFALIGQYSQKTIFSMTSVRSLEFEKFRFFCQTPNLGMENRICVPNLIEIG